MEVTKRLRHLDCELKRLRETDVISQCVRQGIGMVGADNAEWQNLANGGQPEHQELTMVAQFSV